MTFILFWTDVIINIFYGPKIVQHCEKNAVSERDGKKKATIAKRIQKKSLLSKIDFKGEPQSGRIYSTINKQNLRGSP